MQIPKISGLIDRRILVNYQVDPSHLARIVPAPFRPKTIHGVGIAGICLIRLKQIHPAFMPNLGLGIGSENAAHRIAVEWDEAGQVREGVFIPRRDTNSRLNTLAGGRIFPGEHQLAQFKVLEESDCFNIDLNSEDGETHVSIRAKLAQQLPTTSIFTSLAEASAFFEAGSLGYSVTRTQGQFHGLELQSQGWRVEPLEVTQVSSSFFDNQSMFPTGSIRFDCALIMRGIQHTWQGRDTLCCTVAA